MGTVSRRDFLIAGAAAGGGLLVGCRTGGSEAGTVAATGAAAPVAPPPAFAPNAFVRVGTDGGVAIVVPQVEMGQGMYTAMTMLVAEELEVGLDQVRVEHAPPDDKRYANPLLGFQVTGASSSVRAFHKPLREAGAAARTLLVQAAASSWGVEPAACKATRGTVVHEASGRSLAYGALADAAAKLPAPATVALKDPSAFTLVGTPAKRVDSADKSRGKAMYGIDTRVPGMLVATVAACPVVGGTVKSVQEGAAKSVKGVRTIVRLDDVVAVVGDHMWAAKQGLASLRIEWEMGANGTVSTADVSKGLHDAADGPAVVARQEGDTDAALRRAARTLEATYEAPFLAHATMEPMNCTVHARKDGCEVWTGSQVLSRAQAVAAKVTGLPLEKVVVHNHLLGGGFGRRLETDYVEQAVRIAMHVDAPVKVVWTREEDVTHDVYRPHYLAKVKAGVDGRGMPVAWSHRVVGPSIVARWAPPAFKDGIDGDAVDAALKPAYDFPSLRIEYLRHEEPVLRTGFWRGVGPTHNNFVIESFVDELAAAAGQDAVAYRRALLHGAPRAKHVLELAAKASGWGTSLPAGRARGVALLSAWNTSMAQVAEIELLPGNDIRVHRVTCAVDCGMTVNPDIVRAQVESAIIFGISSALYGEITLRNGQVEQRNFNNYRVLRNNEAPAIEVIQVKSGEAPGGIGEPGTACVQPALANAVFAATKKRARTLPLVRNLAALA